MDANAIMMSKLLPVDRKTSRLNNPSANIPIVKLIVFFLAPASGGLNIVPRGIIKATNMIAGRAAAGLLNR